jgi:hypothetical protein
MIEPRGPDLDEAKAAFRAGVSLILLGQLNRPRRDVDRLR